MDKRLLVNERVSEEITERIKVSSSAIDIYFAASPAVKRFEQSAHRIEAMVSDMNSLKSEARDASTSLARLEGTSAKMSDLFEIRDRLLAIEPLVSQVSSVAKNYSSDLKAVEEGIEAIKVDLSSPALLSPIYYY